MFKNLAMRVKLDRKPEADTPVDAFVEDLKRIPCLHFCRNYRGWRRGEAVSGDSSTHDHAPKMTMLD